MKYKFIFILFLVVAVNNCNAQLSNISLEMFNGVTQNTSSFQGKKVLVVTLPVQRNYAAERFMQKLDSLFRLHKDSLVVIAVPSIEDGFSIIDSSVTYDWYRNILNSGEIILKATYTHKNSAILQHPLFKYLTRISENLVFNIDANAPLMRFYISKAGELYGVLGVGSIQFGVSEKVLIRI